MYHYNDTKSTKSNDNDHDSIEKIVNEQIESKSNNDVVDKTYIVSDDNTDNNTDIEEKKLEYQNY